MALIRRSILARKKLIFFSDILHMPTKSMPISPRFFSFSKNLKNRNPSSDFKMNQFSRFCRNLSILKYDGAKNGNGNFRKFLKNQDFEHFGHQICSRSDFRPGKFLALFWAVEHIRPPYDSKSHFSKKTRKLRN